MCPKPSPSSEANSSYPCGNASSHAVPENDQPGPSTAIPHLPTVESHESADDTTGKCKTKAIAVFLAGGNADPGLN